MAPDGHATLFDEHRLHALGEEIETAVLGDVGIGAVRVGPFQYRRVPGVALTREDRAPFVVRTALRGIEQGDAGFRSWQVRRSVARYRTAAK